MQHVVAASGYNVSLILTLAHFLVGRFKRLYRLLILGGLIVLYAALTDLGPPIIRAVGMSQLALTARLLWFRQYQPLWALVLVSVFMVLFTPALWTSVSFQLSVSATLGICLVLPVLTRSSSYFGQALRGEVLMPSALGNSTNTSRFTQVWEMFKESFLTTCAAQSFTLPLTLVHFQELSLLSWPANTFLLWLTPLITSGGVMYLVGSLALSWLPGLRWLQDSVMAYLWLPTALFVALASWLGQFESTLLRVTSFTWWAVLIWWGGLLGGLAVWSRIKSSRPRYFFERSG